jgi:hypothetical protein
MIGVAIALCLMLSALQSSAQTVQNKEDMLAAAGFVTQPANTPRRLAALKSLPPHKLLEIELARTFIGRDKLGSMRWRVRVCGSRLDRRIFS